jgi:acyl-CoA synthetase (NDP forming)
MTIEEKDHTLKRMVRPAPGAARPALHAMLEARSVALVGASPRPGSFGQRMVDEVGRSPAGPDIYLVNPRYRQIGERICYPSLADLPGPADLVLLGVPDAALEEQLSLAARCRSAAAVIFGNAHEDPPGQSGPAPAWPGGQPARPGWLPLRERLAAIARTGGMELCGAGCMGFVNVARGLRAIGYVEPGRLPAGPVALVTHSGSVFSAMLRSGRAIGFTLAVSSGQELVTTAAAYLEYALTLPETRVLALVLEAIREPGRLRAALASAAARDIPAVLLSAGSSASGQAMVAAHSGALAAQDGGWEALADAYGVHRAGDLAELADTLELFAIGRRARLPGTITDGGRTGIATVHDSGLERAHAVDLADQLGVPYASIGEPTLARLARLLDPGLQPANPLDMWGTGSDAQQQFADALAALAEDRAVAAVALAVDLVREFDGDRSYPNAVLAAAARTAKPVAVLASLASAIDQHAAAELRQAGIPVLEGMRTGLLALRHLLDHAARTASASEAGPAGRPPGPGARRAHGMALLAAGQAAGAPLLDLLREYGIAAARAEPAADLGTALAAASAIGYPVVLKTDEPAVLHKSDSGGVLLGIRGPDELTAAYRELSGRLGPRAIVSETIPPGTELALGIAHDADLGPLIVVGAGGVLVELLADRAVALPPVTTDQARRMIGRLRAGRLLAGVRGAPPADTDAVIRAITGLSALATELGSQLEALDVNPLICGPDGAVAVDALAIPRGRR